MVVAAGRPRLLQAENVDGVGGGRDAKKGARNVEGHAIYGTRVGAPAKLEELLTARDGEHPDNGARLARCG